MVIIDGIARTVTTLREAGISTPRIVIGGAPVTPEYAREIGADGYAPDAASAVDLARRLLDLPGSAS